MSALPLAKVLSLTIRTVAKPISKLLQVTTDLGYLLFLSLVLVLVTSETALELKE